MSNAGLSVASASSKCMTAGWWIGLLSGAVVVVYGEWSRHGGEQAAWLFDINIDSTPYVLWLLMLPLCWWIREPLFSWPPRCVRLCRSWFGDPASTTNASTDVLRTGLLMSVVAAVAVLSCWQVADLPAAEHGPAFGLLPPAFHDEFSYLFQAETFRAGRWSFDSHPTVPRMFDQMHVLNEGHFASRYFPGAGAWIAPFLTFGSPYVGHWLATALIAAFVVAIGRELSCNGVGLLAGLLTALAPGMNLFGNLLLAHQPTLVGLSLFIWACLRLFRLLGNSLDRSELSVTVRPLFCWALLASSGLAFGMLCRPMTAAGVGLPFGIWLACWLGRHGRKSRSATVAVIVGFGLPLALAFGVLGWQNLGITGQLMKSPYSLYTELFTPRHQYGFNNVVRAEAHLTERVLDHYDRWAENLTPTLAAWNVGIRLLASWLWTLGPVAILISLGAFIGGQIGNPARRWWLIPAAILSLHLVHVPYWFSGIMHWHYVFESGPLWCLIVACATERLGLFFRGCDRPLMPLWWGAALLTAVSVNQFAFAPLWSISRVEAGMHELAFSRLKQFEFQRAIAAIPRDTPAIVFVRHDPADRHIDYVSNHPSLSGPLLIARLPVDSKTSEEETLNLAIQAFPERRLFVFDAKQRMLLQIR